jgi:transcription antitermination factor NusG
MKQWFVGTTKHQQELFAAANLRAQGYLVYLPKRYERDQQTKSAKACLRFTGYVFVRFDAGLKEHSPINSTRGMDSDIDTGSALLLNPSRDPQPINPQSIIEMLRWLEDDELERANSRKKALPRTDLAPGDLVRIDQPGPPGHPAHGKEGCLIRLERGVWDVLVGLVTIWKIAESDLKRIDRKKAA